MQRNEDSGKENEAAEAQRLESPDEEEAERTDVRLEVPLLRVSSDDSYERRLLVAPAQMETFEFFPLRHPRANRPALYHVDDEGRVLEVLQRDLEKRSCFYEDSVINPPDVHLLSPVHPFLLVDSLACWTKLLGSRFSLDSLLADEKFPALSKFGRFPSVQTAVRLAADSDESGELARNDEKLAAWLKGRFEKLVGLLKAADGISASIREDDGKLKHARRSRSSRTTSRPLWPPAFAPSGTSGRRLPNGRSQGTPTSSKRKLEDKASAKKAATAAAAKKRKMLEASRGTMQLSHFFKK
ncbi:hypothetical protein M3Y99_01887900 [Aphelenchoides fujianensis]|nr:hypothetical protein M3Y99_01887900 [Aphelenchoides fujianensis]